jgi:hypothetical protein
MYQESDDNQTNSKMDDRTFGNNKVNHTTNSQIGFLQDIGEINDEINFEAKSSKSVNVKKKPIVDIEPLERQSSSPIEILKMTQKSGQKLKLDREKVDVLLDEFAEYLSYEDLFEIKKQVNLLNAQGKLLPARIAFMESRKNILKKKHMQNEGNVTKYIFEDPTPAILISLMQLTSALITELLNIIVLSGMRTITRSIANFVAIKVISEIDNIYLNAI